MNKFDLLQFDWLAARCAVLIIMKRHGIHTLVGREIPTVNKNFKISRCEEAWRTEMADILWEYQPILKNFNGKQKPNQNLTWDINIYIFYYPGEIVILTIS